jgi:hypothetical protein
VGVEVEAKRGPTPERTRTFTLSRNHTENIVHTVHIVQNGVFDSASRGEGWTIMDDHGRCAPADRPSKTPSKTGLMDVMDDVDDLKRLPSGNRSGNGDEDGFSGVELIETPDGGLVESGRKVTVG